MSSIVYTYSGKLYVNLTNRCPCSCVFCIRGMKDGVGSSDSLWLDEEPTAEQVIAGLGDYNLKEYGEVIFCGYGEPFCALDNMLAVCQYIRSVGDVKIRVNTNGLGDLINEKPTAHLLAGNIDTVSISLNAPDADQYDKLCHPAFGSASYDAMLRFAEDCRAYVADVRLTVVDVIPQEDIDVCRRIAQELAMPFRVRHCG